MPIINDTGFNRAVSATPLQPLAALESGGGDEGAGLAINNDADARDLVRYFHLVPLIAISFPNFADGRGFSLARQLRALGFTGRLRAKGHVIADQYPMARACGFDEVEVDDSLAERQPEQHWLSSQSEWGHALSASQLRAAE